MNQNQQIAENSCSLCCQPIFANPIIDAAFVFCCHGCQAVYSILSMQGNVNSYRESVLFKEAVRSGVISNPALLEEIQAKSEQTQEEEVHKFYFEIGEMWCPSCAELIRLVLMQEIGIKNCFVDYATDLACVEFYPKRVGKEKIFNRIKALGYKAELLEDRQKKGVSFFLYLRFGIAAFCALNAMMFAYPLYATYLDLDKVEGSHHIFFAWLSLFISLPAVAYSGWPIFRRCWSSLIVGELGMEVLITLGVSAAFGLSVIELIQGGTQVYFDSMTVIIAFVLLGKIIESKAKFSAKESIYRLHLALPKRGRKRLQDGHCLYVGIKEFFVGDLLEVRMGEMIVLNGEVVDGQGICNESLMTGESIPVTKNVGDLVLGGTTLQHGTLLVKVCANAEQSAFQTIVEIVEKQMTSKQIYYRPADAIIRLFIPLVVAFAVFTGLFCWFFAISDTLKTPLQTAILRAIAILLICCPCAIGIATPAVESYLIQALARLGAIVRNRASLNVLGNETVFLFDKTGTMTEGQFSLLEGLESFSSSEKGILKTMISLSNHPIANAIGKSLQGNAGEDIDKVDEILGKGIRAIFRGKTFFLGSKKFLKEHFCIPSLNSRHELATIVYFGKKGGIAKPLVFGDRLRKESKSLLAKLKPAKTLLISGDSSEAVAQVALHCGFDDYLSQVSPLEKQEIVKKLKEEGNRVCMVGDGVNDALALGAADIGISVANATDISIQISDILLTSSDLSILPKMRGLASKARKIANQNLFWAFFYNVIGIGLAAFGWLSPLFSAFAMTMSSLIVLFNAMRLSRVSCRKKINVEDAE